MPVYDTYVVFIYKNLKKKLATQHGQIEYLQKNKASQPHDHRLRMTGFQPQVKAPEVGVQRENLLHLGESSVQGHLPAHGA